MNKIKEMLNKTSGVKLEDKQSVSDTITRMQSHIGCMKKIVKISIVSLIVAAIYDSLVIKKRDNKSKTMMSIQEEIEKDRENNYKITSTIIENVSLMQQQKEKDMLSELEKNLSVAFKNQIQNSKTIPAFGGGKNPKKEVVIFYDHSCTYCKTAYNEVVKSIQSNPDVKVYHMMYPFLSLESLNSAKIALYLNKNHKAHFNDFTAEIFAMKQKITKENIISVLNKIGSKIDSKKFDEIIKDKDIEKEVASHVNIGRKAGLTGVPMVMINDTKTSETRIISPYELKALI